MEVPRTSMIHAVAPHFMWSFAVRYAAHQLNLWPRVSELETSPTLRWTGKVGDASVFRVWGALSLVCDAKASKLSSHTLRCVFLGFPTDAPPWQFHHPRERRIFSSQDVTFDESMCFYRLHPHASHPVPLTPLFLVPVPPPPGAVDSGAEAAGAEFGGAETEGEGSGGVATRGATTKGAESGGAVSPSGGEVVGDPTGGSPCGGWYGPASAGAASPGGTGGTAGCAGGAAGAGGTRGAAGAGGARPTIPRGATGSGGAGPTSPSARGAGAAGAHGAAGVGGTTGAASVGGAGASCAGRAGAFGTATRRLFFYSQPQSSLPLPDSVLRQVLSLPFSTGLTPPLLCPPTDQSQPHLLPCSLLPALAPHTEVTESLTKRRDPESRASTPVRARRVARPRPPGVPGTHGMTLRPSSVPQRVVLLEPHTSSLPHVLDPESDLARAASPTVTRLLATFVTDPDIESTSAFSLVTELVEFAARTRLDYVASLVTESECVCPPSVGGEPALSSDVLEDRQFELECLAAALPRFASMLLCPEGDPDALDIPTLRSYTKAVAGEYSS
ncbi:unnamed protein product [Closterium sp. NIES-54]